MAIKEGTTGLYKDEKKVLHPCVVVGFTDETPRKAIILPGYKTIPVEDIFPETKFSLLVKRDKIEFLLKLYRKKKTEAEEDLT